MARELPAIGDVLPPTLAAHLEGPDTPASLEDELFPELPALAQAGKHGKDVTDRIAKARLRASALLILRGQGYSVNEIAKLLEMSRHAVRKALVRARQAGRLNELRSVLENDSLALAIDGLNYHLERRDKEAIFKHLEGMGQWKSYGHQKAGADGAFHLPALQVNIQFAPGSAPREPVTIDVLGTPRQDDEEPT